MNPVMVRIIPTMGMHGTSGQIIMVMSPRMPLAIMIMTPVMRMRKREKKPTKREMERSIKAWNFESREASLDALPAEICRYGWKRVRINDEIEKKSVRLAKRSLSLWTKTFQPAVYHQESISIIAITILYNKK